MRKVVYGLAMSLDGYLARLDGAVDFLLEDPAYDMAPFFRTVDTGILGRKTMDVALELGGGAWPYGPELKCYVMSRKQKPGVRGPVEWTRQQPKELVRAIRRRKGKDIWLMGGGEVAHDFLRADLVDRLYLGVMPVLLGEGIPAFPAGFPQRDFVLTQSRAYPSGMLELTYDRKLQARVKKAARKPAGQSKK
jgi:dihydrofolate reductase